MHRVWSLISDHGLSITVFLYHRALHGLPPDEPLNSSSINSKVSPTVSRFRMPYRIQTSNAPTVSRLRMPLQYPDFECPTVSAIPNLPTVSRYESPLPYPRYRTLDSLRRQLRAHELHGLGQMSAPDHRVLSLKAISDWSLIFGHWHAQKRVGSTDRGDHISILNDNSISFSSPLARSWSPSPLAGPRSRTNWSQCSGRTWNLTVDLWSLVFWFNRTPVNS